MKVEVWIAGEYVGTQSYFPEFAFKLCEVYRQHTAPRESRFRVGGVQYVLIEVR